MKTAISIPDRLFRQAERLAKKLGISRSQLYARAVEKLVNDRAGTEITKKLNEVYPGGKGSELDAAWRDASVRALGEGTKDDSW